MNDSYKNHDLVKGFIVSNVFAFTLIGITKFSVDKFGGDNHDEAGVMVFSEFIIIPILMGIICSWNWRNLQIKGRKSSGCTLFRF